MVENKSLYWKNVMNFGAIVGLALIIYAVILFVFGVENSRAAGYLNYIILIAGIYIGTKQFRDTHNNGVINYSNALGSGVLIALFASIIAAFYTYIFMQFIDPEAMEKMIVTAEEQLIERGIPDDQIEMQMEMSRKFMTPAVVSLITIPTYTFFGFLFSLVIAAIVKKEGDPFQQDMKEINDTEE